MDTILVLNEYWLDCACTVIYLFLNIFPRHTLQIDPTTQSTIVCAFVGVVRCCCEFDCVFCVSNSLRPNCWWEEEEEGKAILFIIFVVVVGRKHNTKHVCLLHLIIIITIITIIASFMDKIVISCLHSARLVDRTQTHSTLLLCVQLCLIRLSPSRLLSSRIDALNVNV